MIDKLIVSVGKKESELAQYLAAGRLTL